MGSIVTKLTAAQTEALGASPGFPPALGASPGFPPSLQEPQRLFRKLRMPLIWETTGGRKAAQLSAWDLSLSPCRLLLLHRPRPRDLVTPIIP